MPLPPTAAGLPLPSKVADPASSRFSTTTSAASPSVLSTNLITSAVSSALQPLFEQMERLERELDSRPAGVIQCQSAAMSQLASTGTARDVSASTLPPVPTFLKAGTHVFEKDML